jgi:hypothetical protein
VARSAREKEQSLAKAPASLLPIHFIARRSTHAVAAMFAIASSVATAGSAAPSARLASSRRVSPRAAQIARASNRRSSAIAAVEGDASAGDASTAVADKNDDIAEFLATQMVDEAAMLASSTFPVSPETLIANTKRILAKNNGAEEPALLASDFKFVAPVVGPLGKEEFLKAFASFKIEYYAFRVDPFEPNRVWYDARFTGTNTGKLAGSLEPTNKRVEAPPQACSMLFNEKGEATQLTVGYVMDRQLGNTGGLGGVFGILYAIGYGLPFPEAQPWQKSIQYDLFQKVSGMISPIQKFVKGLSGGSD